MASTSSRPTETSRARAMAATLADVLSKPHANPISIRLMKGRPEVHDRFLIVDDQAWSLGSSLNEFGDRGTLLLKVPYTPWLLPHLEAAWQRADALDAWLADTENA